MATQQSASGVLPASDMLPARKPSSGAITKAMVKSFKPASGASEGFLWDTTVSGLGLRAYASGRKVWLFQYRDVHGRTRRMGLGDAMALSPDEARAAARRLVVQEALGNDPAKARHTDRQGGRVLDLIESYVGHLRGHVRPNTLDHTSRNLRKYAEPLHSEPIAAVDRATVYRLHGTLTKSSGAVQANRVLASLSAMFAWAMKAGLAENNPAALVPRNAEQARERVLTDSELRTLWAATAGEGDYDRIVRLLLLTGCRREEIAGLRWSEIEGDKLVLPASRTKTKVLHEVPLTALALAQLPTPVAGRDLVFGKGGGGFSGWSRAKARLDEKLGDWPDWGLHDLRRTLSTRLNEADVEPHVVEALLGHAGARSGVAGVYNRASYRVQKRDALELWEKLIQNLIL
jgi:integrase